MLPCHLQAIPVCSPAKSTLSDMGVERKGEKEDMKNNLFRNMLWVVGIILCVCAFVFLFFPHRKTPIPQYMKDVPPMKVRVNCDFYVFGPCLLELEAINYNSQTIRLWEGDRVKFSVVPTPSIWNFKASEPTVPETPKP